MQTLYDSESFVVLHLLTDLAQDDENQPEAQRAAWVREGFEIVDKRIGKEVYLDGAWADVFQRQILAWQENTPTQEEIEDTLESYTQLAQTSTGLH